MTGRLADGWIPSLGYAAPEQIPAMRDRVHAAARDAGRDPEEITCVYNIEVRVDERLDVETLGPSVVSGAAGAVAERLAGFVAIGFTSMNFLPAGPGEDEQAEILARDVIPAVRAAA